MLTDENMIIASELFRYDQPEEVLEPRHKSLMHNAMMQALQIIFDNHAPFNVNEWTTRWFEELIDPRWPISIARTYDRKDKMQFIVAICVVYDPFNVPTLENQVAAKSDTFEGALFSAIILAALLKQKLDDTPPTNGSPAAGMNCAFSFDGSPVKMAMAA